MRFLIEQNGSFFFVKFNESTFLPQTKVFKKVHFLKKVYLFCQQSILFHIFFFEGNTAYFVCFSFIGLKYTVISSHLTANKNEKIKLLKMKNLLKIL